MTGVDAARRIASRYLTLADRLLPGRIVGFYLVGSTALGAYREGRSDIDFIAVVDGPVAERELRRVRLTQLASGARAASRALARGHVALPGTVNGAYVDAADLTRPVSSIRPIASHVAAAFHKGVAFDVNPVVWKELRDHGVPLRGADPSRLGLDPEPDTLRGWNIDNLNRYWQRWADAAANARRASWSLHPTGWIVAWGVLGAPRLHCTIKTGEIISKEAAGTYALDTFDRRWHPIIADGLAFQRCERAAGAASRSERIREAAHFVHEVVRSANALPA